MTAFFHTHKKGFVGVKGKMTDKTVAIPLERRFTREVSDVHRVWLRGGEYTYSQFSVLPIGTEEGNLYAYEISSTQFLSFTNEVIVLFAVMSSPMLPCDRSFVPE